MNTYYSYCLYRRKNEEGLDEKFGKEGRGGMWKKLQDKYGGITNLPDNDMPVTWTSNNL